MNAEINIVQTLCFGRQEVAILGRPHSPIPYFIRIHLNVNHMDIYFYIRISNINERKNIWEREMIKRSRETMSLLCL